jgi:rhamnulokinase
VVTGGLVAAVDLGASSGRVIVAEVGPNSLALQEVLRFPNDPVALPDGLHWDIERLYQEMLTGLRQAARLSDRLGSVGIDSWGVDYALLDETGGLLGNPYHYRDSRTQSAAPRVHGIVPPEELYRRTGIQHLPFNTIYQLAAHSRLAHFGSARNLVMIPDLLGYWLTGVVTAELTNASTTALLDASTRSWAVDLLERLGLPASILSEPRRPGEPVGPLRDEARTATGLGSATQLTLVGSHDTASAIVGVPAEGDRFAYICCGTWSLVGVELDTPVLNEASRAANFTNEIGVDGRVRYLRNVMGLWLLQESMRTWQRAGDGSDLAGLIEAAAEVPAGGPIIDPDSPAFLAPGDMPSRIGDAIADTGLPVPSSRPELVRCILDSLAASHARALRDVIRLSGRAVDVVHLVGGGARNALLCQLTADACERPVIAGPAEATAIGNVLVQARAAGIVHGDLASIRGLVRSTQELRRFEPRTVAARSRQLRS